MYKKSSVYILTVWTVNDVLVDPYSFFVLVDSYNFYCIKKEWIDQNKQGYGTFLQQLECGYEFPALIHVWIASAGVLEWFISTSGEATSACKPF